MGWLASQRLQSHLFKVQIKGYCLSQAKSQLESQLPPPDLYLDLTTKKDEKKFDGDITKKMRRKMKGNIIFKTVTFSTNRIQV